MGIAVCSVGVALQLLGHLYMVYRGVTIAQCQDSRRVTILNSQYDIIEKLQ